jgi:alkylated DNA nucleotide flippase Atl1
MPEESMGMNLTPTEKKVFETLERTAWVGETITYGEVGHLIGFHPQDVGGVLYSLQTKLNKAGYPPLNYLVVNRVTGMPGPGVNKPFHGEILDPLGMQVRVWRHYSTFGSIKRINFSENTWQGF